MYDHIGLKVGDLKASVRFYEAEAALAPLGHELCAKTRTTPGSAPEVKLRCGCTPHALR
jgi:catechol 2,3-dioxygenase-like lactoylglutathione lyase family enzyme